VICIWFSQKCSLTKIKRRSVEPEAIGGGLFEFLTVNLFDRSFLQGDQNKKAAAAEAPPPPT
jgi:hypothetical protein